MTVEEMEGTLSRLRIEFTNTRGDEIQGFCPAHKERTGKEDRNPSWWINSDTGQHICFSCGFKGGIYSLISYVEQIDFDKAKDWFDSSENLMSRFTRITEERKSKLEDVSYVTESMLHAFVDPPQEALDSRGLTINAARAYELMWDERKNNWIMPIRDPITNKLMGWQEKGYDRRYFNNQPSKVKKSLSLFGYREYVAGDMVVVESPLDVVRLASVGITGGVSTYGAIVSSAQFNLLRGADRLIFALDNDSAGQSSSKSLLDMCRETWKEALFFNYSQTDMKDIGAMSKVEIEFGLENAKHMVRGKV